VQADAGNTGDSTNPTLVFADSGEALALWMQYDLSGQNIWASRYQPGIGWVSSQIIDTENLGDALYPQLAVNALGDALAVWQQSNGQVSNIWSNSYLLTNSGVPNIPPVAWSFWSIITLELNEGQEFTALDGALSFDQDGSIVSYNWSQTGGQVVSLSGSDSAVASFTAPQVYQDETLSFLLTVTDDQGATGQLVITAVVHSTNSDDDVDGLDDLWEIQYFGNLLQDNTTDFDGDGITVLQEYLNGNDPTLVTLPAPLNVSAQGLYSQIYLSWDPVAGASGYNIYWSSQPGVTRETGNKLLTVSSTYLHSNVLSSNYYYVVTALSEDESVASAEVSAATNPLVPDVPTGVSAVSTADGVSLSWDIASGADRYLIYWDTSPGVTKDSGNLAATVTSGPFVHTGLQQGDRYYYVIIGDSSTGQSPPSVEVSAIAAQEPLDPALLIPILYNLLF
jgi:hypothetical protein